MPGCFQGEAGLTAVSLFSGAGGLDVGFERAGFEVVFANEFDRDAAAAWRANRPEIAGVMAEGDVLDYMGGLRAFEGGVVSSSAARRARASRSPARWTRTTRGASSSGPSWTWSRL